MLYSDADPLAPKWEFAMSYVEEVVKRRLSAGPSDFTFQQTVRIPERAHQRLRALAEFMGVPKTTLLGELVVAAIDQAVEALPNEPFDLPIVPADHLPEDQRPPHNLREYVRWRAEALYREVQLQHEAQTAPEGHFVREDE